MTDTVLVDDTVYSTYVTKVHETVETVDVASPLNTSLQFSSDTVFGEQTFFYRDAIHGDTLRKTL